ncbi:MAG: hypothetical protein LQ337_005470 [Flavoplaca oasis]|nr:MAG: hypothetical protein LQ337_005470 [Flavoplaca oasis]
MRSAVIATLQLFETVSHLTNAASLPPEHLASRDQNYQTQQQFDETTARFEHQGLCRLYIDSDNEEGTDLRTCKEKCGELVNNPSDTTPLDCNPGGDDVAQITDPNGDRYNHGECRCQVPLARQVVDGTPMSLPDATQIGCPILYRAFDAILDDGLAAIRKQEEYLDIGMNASIEAAKTISDSGKKADSFLDWFDHPCEVGNYTDVINKIFQPLCEVSETVVPYTDKTTNDREKRSPKGGRGGGGSRGGSSAGGGGGGGGRGGSGSSGIAGGQAGGAGSSGIAGGKAGGAKGSPGKTPGKPTKPNESASKAGKKPEATATKPANKPTKATKTTTPTASKPQRSITPSQKPTSTVQLSGSGIVSPENLSASMSEALSPSSEKLPIPTAELSQPLEDTSTAMPVPVVEDELTATPVRTMEQQATAIPLETVESEPVVDPLLPTTESLMAIPSETIEDPFPAVPSLTTDAEITANPTGSLEDDLTAIPFDELEGDATLPVQSLTTSDQRSQILGEEPTATNQALSDESGESIVDVTDSLLPTGTDIASSLIPDETSLPTTLEIATVPETASLKPPEATFACPSKITDIPTAVETTALAKRTGTPPELAAQLQMNQVDRYGATYYGFVAHPQEPDCWVLQSFAVAGYNQITTQPGVGRAIIVAALWVPGIGVVVGSKPHVAPEPAATRSTRARNAASRLTGSAQAYFPTYWNIVKGRSPALSSSLAAWHAEDHVLIQAALIRKQSYPLNSVVPPLTGFNWRAKIVAYGRFTANGPVGFVPPCGYGNNPAGANISPSCQEVLNQLKVRVGSLQ